MQMNAETTLNYLYREFEIHFMVYGTEKEVMVNATEMAKAFQKRTGDYLDNDATKKFIAELELQANENDDKLTLNSVRIIENRGRNGMYFCDVLSLHFAMWLDVSFQVWLLKKILSITLGEYKKHFDAHLSLKKEQENEKNLRLLVTKEPTAENYKAIVDSMDNQQLYKNAKTKAINTQLKFF